MSLPAAATEPVPPMPRGIHNAYIFDVFNTISWTVVMGAPMLLYLQHLRATATILAIAASLAPLLSKTWLRFSGTLPLWWRGGPPPPPPPPPPRLFRPRMRLIFIPVGSFSLLAFVESGAGFTCNGSPAEATRHGRTVFGASRSRPGRWQNPA